MKFFRRHSFTILCCLPLVFFLLFMTLLPIIRVWILSFQVPLSTEFTFLNYITLWHQKAFHEAFINTFIIALGSVTLELGLGLFMALLLFHRPQISKLLKPFFLFPLAIPTVVVAVMMSYLFSSSGWLNRLLIDCHLIQNPILWTDGGAKSLIMIILSDSWKVTPLVMLILLGGLQSIDPELYKAARIDGAGGLTIFKRITFPLLLPFITTAIIIRGIDAFRIFALVLILMGENLRVIGTHAYLEYMDYQNIHLSAASSVVLFIIILLFIIIYLKIVGKKGLVAF